MGHQFAGIADHTGRGHGSIGSGTENTHNGDIFRFLQLGQQEFLVLGHILPYTVFFLEVIGRGQQLKLQADEIAIAIFLDGGVDGGFLAGHGISKGLSQLFHIQQTQGIEGEVGDAVVVIHDQHHFVPISGQTAVQHLILGIQQLRVGGQLAPYIQVGHHTAAHSHTFKHFVEEVIGVDLENAAGQVGLINVQRGGVQIADLGCQILDAVSAVVQKLLEGSQIVGGGGREHHIHHIGHHIGRIDFIFLIDHIVLFGLHGAQHSAHINGLGFQRQRIAGKGVFFHIGNVVVDAGGQAQNQRNADDADGAGKGGKDGAALFGHQVAQREGKCGQRGHGSVTTLAAGNNFHIGVIVRIGVAHNIAVQQADGAGGIGFCQFRIVGDHNHQTILGDLLQQLHNLHRGLRVQCAGGFVCQQDLRVVDQGAGDGHALHLTAGHLVGLFVKLIAQTHLFQGFYGAAATLCLLDTGKGQRQLYIGQHRLVGDQVVALKHKAYGVIAVSIPVLAFEVLGGTATDDQVTGGILVQATDDVQQGGFATTGVTQDRHEFRGTEGDAHAFQSGNGLGSGYIVFNNVG